MPSNDAGDVADTSEETAARENELIDAARELMEEHGYSREDVEGVLKGAVFS